MSKQQHFTNGDWRTLLISMSVVAVAVLAGVELLLPVAWLLLL